MCVPNTRATYITLFAYSKRIIRAYQNFTVIDKIH